MPGSWSGFPCAFCQASRTCTLAGFCGHLIQRRQQPQPAGEADFLPRTGPEGLPGSAATRRRREISDEAYPHQTTEGPEQTPLA